MIYIRIGNKHVYIVRQVYTKFLKYIIEYLVFSFFRLMFNSHKKKISLHIKSKWIKENIDNNIIIIIIIIITFEIKEKKDENEY